MEAISGRSGRLIWVFDNDARSTTMNFYTPLYLNKDYDRDGLPDMVTVHGGDPTRNPRKCPRDGKASIVLSITVDEKVRLAGELLLISSRTGRLMNVSVVPDRMESYYSPQLLKRSSTEEFILVGTGGETHGGGLYAFDVSCFTRSCSSPVSSTLLLNPDPHSLLYPSSVCDDHHRCIQRSDDATRSHRCQSRSDRRYHHSTVQLYALRFRRANLSIIVEQNVSQFGNIQVSRPDIDSVLNLPPHRLF